MLFSAAVVLAFFLCWLPFHTQRIAFIYFNESKFYRKVNEYLFYISGVLYYFSATVNPILYNLMSLKYRHAFYQTLFGRNGCCCCKGKDSNNQWPYLPSCFQFGHVTSFKKWSKISNVLGTCPSRIPQNYDLSW